MKSTRFFSHHFLRTLAPFLVMMLAVTTALAGYTPARTGITHPDTTTDPSFNNYTDGSGAFVDERAFSVVQNYSGSTTGDNLNVEAGDSILFMSLLNNSGPTATGVSISSDSYYENGSGKFVSAPFSTSLDINHLIDGANTVPARVTDTATVTSNLGDTLRLRYVASNFNMFVLPAESGSPNYYGTGVQTDFFGSGVSVGDAGDPLSGTFDGGDSNRVMHHYWIYVEAADADLSITKSVNNTSVNVGDTVTYTLSYANSGPIEATGVTIVDDYDETKMSVNGGSLPAGCTDNGDTVTCDISGEVANGGSGQVVYTATATATGTATNTATISSDMNDPSVANNSDSVMVDFTDPLLIEDGANLSGWWTYDSTPSVPVIPTVAAESGYIKMRGNGASNGWTKRITPGILSSDFEGAQWDWTIEDADGDGDTNEGEMGKFYWRVKTNNGFKIISYVPHDQECYLKGLIVCGVGYEVVDGLSHTVVVDLQEDIHKVLPSTNIEKVVRVYVRGDAKVDNIKLLSSYSPNAISGNVKREGVNLENATVSFTKAGGGAAPMAVKTDVSGNYSQYGFENGETYTVEVTYVGSPGVTFTSTGVTMDAQNKTADFNGTASTDILYVNGSTIQGWEIADSTPSTPIVQRKMVRDGYFRVRGNGTSNSWKSKLDPVNTTNFVAEWDWKLEDGNDSTFFWIAHGDDGQTYVFAYKATDNACTGFNGIIFGEPSKEYVVCGIGSTITDGSWNTFTRDLLADRTSAGYTANLTDVFMMGIRGNASVDNVKLKEIMLE